MAERKDPTPAGEAPVSAEERARAQRLGRLVDAMLAGHGAPPALEAEERALLENATVIHATLGRPGLPQSRLHNVIESAMASRRAEPELPAETPAIPSRTATPLPVRAKRRAGRTKAWAAGASIALVAAALLLIIFRPGPTPPPAVALRSPDAIIGHPIARSEGASATARIDALLADRRGRRRP